MPQIVHSVGKYRAAQGRGARPCLGARPREKKSASPTCADTARAPFTRRRAPCRVILTHESVNLVVFSQHPPMPARSGLSACIITLNEADRIDACLDSLAFCDELIVVDSGSTDDTRERAAAHGARVLVRTFDGYRSQKAYAVGLAAHDWVLCLDADERVTPALRAEIERERDAGFAAAPAIASRA